jgi:hypothetical protein
LDKEAQAQLLETYKNYSSFLNGLINKGNPKEMLGKEEESYKSFKSYFGEILYENLFEKSNYVYEPPSMSIS